MLKITTTTAKIPKAINQQMLEKIIQDGYGMRGKSRWINEAVTSFLKLDNYPELVDIADDVTNKSSTDESEEKNKQAMEIISLRISNELMLALENAVIEIRKLYPAIEGVKGKIIRASIIQRLIRGQ